VDESDAISAILGAVFGALATAVWDMTVAKEKDRTDLSLKFILETLEKQKEISEVVAILENPDVMKDSAPNAGHHRNRVRKIADWYDTIALCYLEHFANRDLLDKAGVTRLIREFALKVEHQIPTLSACEKRWASVYRLKVGNFGIKMDGKNERICN
jgi:hypothetical protein